MKKIGVATGLALLVSGGTAFAQGLVPFAVGPTGADGQPTCSLVQHKLPKDTVVIAAGGYSGRPLDFQIDQSGHQATQFDVVVNADKPVALLLGAYEPTVWNIGWTDKTKVVAVFATGYHKQVVAGLPKGTPILTSSYEDKSPCGFDYISPSKIDWLNPKSRTVFGREVTRVYAKAEQGVLTIAESKKPLEHLVTSSDTPPSSFKLKGVPLAGAAGLQEAEEKGIIRKMTAADVEEVRKAYEAAVPKEIAAKKSDVPPVAGMPERAPVVRAPSISPHRGYVVLKEFTYPAGLYGGNMASFIIPKGVPTPKGNAGHSTVIDLNKLGCNGPMCGSYRQ